MVRKLVLPLMVSVLSLCLIASADGFGRRRGGCGSGGASCGSASGGCGSGGCDLGSAPATKLWSFNKDGNLVDPDTGAIYTKNAQGVYVLGAAVTPPAPPPPAPPDKKRPPNKKNREE